MATYGRRWAGGEQILSAAPDADASRRNHGRETGEGAEASVNGRDDRTSAASAGDGFGPGREGERSPFLSALGDRARALRSRKGMTRRALAIESGVSERHLANLELGVGNASILVLRQIASALDCSLAELVGDETTISPEWLLIRDLLGGRSDDDLRRGRVALAALFGQSTTQDVRRSRIALIGLRGAGKSTLGQHLAEAMNVPFVEVNREIERLAGCRVAEIHALLGQTAYRRYERRALEEITEVYSEAVIATPGGIVSEPTTFNLLLSRCFTVWLKASPEEHMQRVIAQGDLRPMAGSGEAMQDLKRILAGREAFYGKADAIYDTSAKNMGEALEGLRAIVPQPSEETVRQ